MKTIRQFLSGGDLFEEINTITPFPFITPESNALFLIEYGTLPLYSGNEDLTIEELAKILVQLYGDKWLSLLELSSEVLANISAAKKTATTETIASSETREDTRTETDKVSAYNDVSLIDDAGRDSESGGSTTGERERLLETIESDLSKAFERLPKLEKINIIMVAMRDIANFLKIAIY